MTEASADTASSQRGNNWTNGQPFIVTEAHMSMPWSGFRDGRMFRCHMCGEFFKPGDVARFVLCNGVKEAREAGVRCGNVMVCSHLLVDVAPGQLITCDGPDIFQRIAEHERIGKQRYWHLLDPEDCPPNPHSQNRDRRSGRRG